MARARSKTPAASRRSKSGSRSKKGKKAKGDSSTSKSPKAKSKAAATLPSRPQSPLSEEKLAKQKFAEMAFKAYMDKQAGRHSSSSTSVWKNRWHQYPNPTSQQAQNLVHMEPFLYNMSAYRKWGMSYSDLAFSLFDFKTNNEVGNSWVTLFGSLFFWFQFADFCTREHPPKMSNASVQSISVMALGAAIYFTVSFLFHTFNARSRQVFKALLRLRYQSIIVLINASYVPGIHLAFCTDRAVVKGYFMLGAMFALLLFAIQTFADSRDERFKPLRLALFGMNVLWGFGPLLHSYNINGTGNEAAQSVLVRAVLSTGFFYVFGFIMYLFKMPERFASSGTFDVVGQSQNIFHLCIMFGAWTWFRGVCDTAETLAGVGGAVVC